MNKILITLLISITLVGVTYSTGGVSSRNYTHKDKVINQEFDNVYYQLNNQSPTFYDRGDPSAYDFQIGDLTVDAKWHDLDLSSIVPNGAKSILLYISIDDNVTESYLQIRKNGNTNVYNRSMIMNQVANYSVTQDCIIACDSNRIIEYFASAGLNHVYIVVKGWWK